MKKTMSVRALTKVAIMASLAAVLMLFKLNLPFAPGFLKLDFAEVPGLLVAFALGPIQGVITVLLKNVINLAINGTDSQFVGEISNIIVNGSFVFIAGYIYQLHKTFKQAFIAMGVAIVGMSLIAVLSNYFVIFPFYATLYGQPIENLVAMSSKLNPLVHSYLDLMLWTVLPFNLIKGILVSLVTTFIYRHVSPILKK